MDNREYRENREQRENGQFNRLLMTVIAVLLAFVLIFFMWHTFFRTPAVDRDNNAQPPQVTEGTNEEETPAATHDETVVETAEETTAE